MTDVPRRVVVAALMAVLALGGIVALVGADDGTTPPGPVVTGGHAEGRATGLRGFVRPPIPPQDFALHDQDGRLVRLSDYRGRVVLLTFLYTHCKDTCPITAQQIRGALDDLGHDVPALAVSVDPPNDTPASARAFLAKTRTTGRLRFLIGPRSKLKPIWKDYAVAPQTPESEHTAYVLIIDRTGRQRVAFPAQQLVPEDLAHDIRKIEAS